MTTTEIKLSAKQQLFIDKCLAGESMFLTGKAGTGKSFVVKKAIELLQKEGKKIIALAPTGIAANNIQGQTIHSMFSLSPYGVLDFETCNWFKSEKKKMLNAVDVIFIDEVSMLRPDMLDAMNWTLIKNGCHTLNSKQIIFIGDLKQLPAPIDDNMRSMLYKVYESDEFTNAIVYKAIKPHHIELDEVQRQTNEEFIQHLNIVRDGGKSDYFKKFVGAEKAGIILAPHNSTVHRYNADGLAAIDAEEHVFEAVVTGNAKADEFNVENIIRVKHGCKIMYLFNSRNNNLINGTLGTFVVNKAPDSDDNNYFIDVAGVQYALDEIKFTKKEYVLNAQKTGLELKEIGSITQIPIRLAYALTIHKSQGLTFEQITVDLTLPCFSKGQLYTALSRVTSPEGLTIIANRS